MSCLAEKCTSVEIAKEGYVCQIHRGSYFYRVPLLTNIMNDDGYILYQQEGIGFT